MLLGNETDITLEETTVNMYSGMLHRVALKKFTDVSDVLTSSIIGAIALFKTPTSKKTYHVYIIKFSLFLLFREIIIVY
jgi:hypothetical protein